jgi:alpha-tubulin suppressor-like RCC1 family protein
MPNGLPVVAVDCGRDFTVAVTKDGSVFTCGDNADGQLGQGTTSPLVDFHLVKLPAVVSVCCGRDQVFARNIKGKTFAWGDNTEGQLGINHSNKRSEPTRARKLDKLVQIFPGGFHFLGLDAEGYLWTWGYYGEGRLGLGDISTAVLVPTKIPFISNVVAASAGMSHSAALSSDGTIYVWGKSLMNILNYDVEHLNTPHRLWIEGERPNKWLRELADSEIVSLSSGYGLFFVVTSRGRCFFFGEDQEGVALFGDEEVRWKEPRWSHEAQWEKMIRWWFLGRQDPDSVLSVLPVEVLFHLVSLMKMNFRWGIV